MKLDPNIYREAAATLAHYPAQKVVLPPEVAHGCCRALMIACGEDQQQFRPYVTFLEVHFRPPQYWGYWWDETLEPTEESMNAAMEARFIALHLAAEMLENPCHG